MNLSKATENARMRNGEQSKDSECLQASLAISVGDFQSTMSMGADAAGNDKKRVSEDVLNRMQKAFIIYKG